MTDRQETDGSAPGADTDGMFETRATQYQFNAGDESVHGRVLRMLSRRPSRGALLDIGCATGYIAAEATRLGYTVTGLDNDPEALAQAAPHCDRVVQASLEGDAWDVDLEKGKYDVILILDVLEHLRHPDETLRRIRPLLSESGVVYASLPNIAHASVRMHLLSGHFDYQPTGLLDRTHLRFFTYDTIQALFEEAGYVIDATERVIVPLEWAGLPYAHKYDAIRREIEKEIGAETFQYLVRSYPSEPAVQLHHLRAQLHTLRDVAEAKERLERDLEEARSILDPLNQLVIERTSWAQAMEQDLTRATIAIHSLENDIANTRILLSSSQEQLIGREGELDQLRTRAARFEALNRRVEESLADRERAIDTLRAELARAQAEKEAEREGLRAELARAQAEKEAEREGLRAELARAQAEKEAEREGLRAELARAQAEKEAEREGLRAELARAQAEKEAHVHELCNYVQTLERTLDAKNQHIARAEERTRRPAVQLGRLGRLLSWPRSR